MLNDKHLDSLLDLHWTELQSIARLFTCLNSQWQTALRAEMPSATDNPRAGVAHTFFSGETDKARAGELINVLREAEQPVPSELLAFGTTVKKKESKVCMPRPAAHTSEHL